MCHFPPTWKKWLITVKVFAQRGSQMVQFTTVSQCGECVKYFLEAASQRLEPNTTPIQIRVYIQQKNLCKSKPVVWSQWSQKTQQTFFNANILKLTISTCSSRWFTSPGLTNTLHDPKDASRAGWGVEHPHFITCEPKVEFDFYFFGITNKASNLSLAFKNIVSV